MFSKGFYVFRLRYKMLATVATFMLFSWFAFQHIANVIENRTVEAMSFLLTNKIIVIDPGHGGYDSGAIGPGGTKEKDINLQVSKKLAQELEKGGAKVVLIRDSDIDFVTPGEGTAKKRDLDNRLKKVEESKANIYINIQANSFGTKWQGAQTFYNEINENNKILAGLIQEELKRVSNTHREIKVDQNTYMLKNIKIPAVMVEVGFISNPAEEKRLNDPKYQEELAKGIYTGVVKYLAQTEKE